MTLARKPAEKPLETRPLLWHGRHWLIPPVAAPVLWVSAAALHLLQGADPASRRPILALLAAAAALLSLCALLALAGRGLLLRAVGTGSVATGCTWLLHAVAYGPPWKPFITATLLIWALTATGASAILRTWRGGPSWGGFPGLWENIAEETVLENTTARRIKGPAGTLKYLVKLGKVSPAAILDNTEDIAARAQIRPGGVSTAQHPKNAGLIEVTFKPCGPDRTPTYPWPGPSATTIREPIAVGVADSGVRVLLNLAKGHVAVAGMTGSGKSNFAQLIALCVASCRDAIVVAYDGKRNEFGRWRDIMPLVGAGSEQGDRFMAAIKEIVAFRQACMDAWGWRDWQTSPALPMIVVLIDEAAFLVGTASGNGSSAARAWHDLMLTARAAGVRFVLMAQRHSLNSLGSGDARSQFSGNICFGVKEVEDAAYTLSDELMDTLRREARTPATWKDKYPGLCYIEVKGYDSPEVAVRAYEVDDTTLDAALALHATHGLAGHSLQVEADLLNRAMHEMAARSARSALGHLSALVPPNPHDLQPSGRVALTKGGDGAYSADDDAQPDAKMDREDAKAVILELAARPGGVSPAAIVAHTGYSRDWAQRRLKEYVTDGELTQTRVGEYRTTTVTANTPGES